MISATLAIDAAFGQFPGNVTTGCCPGGQTCLGEIFSTIIGCICLGVCIEPLNGDLPDLFNGGGIPGGGGGGGGNGGPAPDLPPPPGPLPPPLPPAQQIGGCAPRAGAVAAVLCPAGCHPNKSGYFLKGGTFIAPKTKCVRNRRRNPLNPRALDRAAGRLRSAQKVGTFLAKVKIPKGRCR